MNVRSKLQEIDDLLFSGNASNDRIYKALSSDDNELWSYLTSNELWGGAGSIADQALFENKDLRKRLEKLLIELGDMQIALGKVNVRTEMWTSAFKKWQSIS
jgi:hypothetical protein